MPFTFHFLHSITGFAHYPIPTLDDVTFAELFVDSLFGTIENVENGNGMRCLKNVNDIRNNILSTIVLRSITEPFWESCIEVTERGQRVCAVGSPGIGKSSTFPLLIRMLLEKGKTVVYLKRNKSKGSWYYQFSPNFESNRLVSASTELFSEMLIPEQIPSLKLKNTYYLIDPDKTEDSCDPSDVIQAKVIINSSCDSKHWGGNEFTKGRDGHSGGVMRFYPDWSLSELLIGGRFIDQTVTEAAIRERYRKFGGRPRAIFHSNDLTSCEAKQNKGISNLTDSQVVEIAKGNISCLDESNTNMPSSSVMGFTSQTPFEVSQIVIASRHVEELVFWRHLRVLWNFLLTAEKSSTFGHGFERYVRDLMLKCDTFEVLPAVGLKHDARKTSKELKLPKVNEIRSVSDVIDMVIRGDDGVIYHSSNEFYAFVDFMFKSENKYYAFQVTVSNSKPALKDSMEKLVERLPDNALLKFYYAVPKKQTITFVTDPVNCYEPSWSLSERCEVMIMLISQPGEEASVSEDYKRKRGFE